MIRDTEKANIGRKGVEAFNRGVTVPTPIPSAPAKRALVSTSLIRVSILLLLYLPLLLPGLVVADAENLPSIISADINSLDDTIPVGGTIISVYTMLSDAFSFSRKEAVCTLIRTTFEGTLTISLPPSQEEWAIHNIPLRMLIQGGSTAGVASPRSILISTTGYLALGSNITISSGTYNYTNTFLKVIGGGLMLQDASTFLIKENTFLPVVDISNTYVVYFTAISNVSISSHSTFGFTHNTVLLSDTYWNSQLYVGYTVLFTTTPVIIHNSSTLTISENKFIFRNYHFVGRKMTWQSFSNSPGAITEVHQDSVFSISSNAWEMVASVIDKLWDIFVVAIYTGCPITITSNSLYAISNNKITISNVSMAGWNIYMLNINSLSPTTLIENGALTIDNNTLIVMGGTTVTGSINRYDILARSLITLNATSSSTISSTIISSPYSSSSLLSISNNSFTAKDVRVADNWVHTDIYVADETSIHNGSTLRIYHNTLTLQNVSVGNIFYAFNFNVENVSPIFIYSGGTISIDSNILVVDDFSVKAWTLSLVFINSQITLSGPGSSMSVSHNNISIATSSSTGGGVHVGSNWVWYLLITNFPITINNCEGLPTASTFEESNISSCSSANLIVSNNNMEVGSSSAVVVVEGSWTLNVVHISSYFTVSQFTRIEIMSNTIKISKLHAKSEFAIGKLYASISPLLSTIATSSPLSISINNVELFDGVVVASKCAMGILSEALPNSHLYITLTTNSTLSISNKSMALPTAAP